MNRRERSCNAATHCPSAATIANLFAKEKDVLTKSIAEKDDQIDELKLKIYRLENEVQSLKVSMLSEYCSL